MAGTSQPGAEASSGAADPDPRHSLDQRRERCPVMRGGQGGWFVYGHADVRRVLHDHETFSNAVSQHLSVPNGMDPPEHTEYRRIIEPYFSAARMAACEPHCGSIASGLAVDTAAAGTADFMQALAGPFAARAQRALLGWPESLHGFLLDREDEGWFVLRPFGRDAQHAGAATSLLKHGLQSIDQRPWS